MSEKKPTAVAVRTLLDRADLKKRFEDVLKGKANQFMTSIISLSNQPNFSDVEPNSIIGCALVSASLDLPIHPALGLAHIIPYNSKKKDKNGNYYWVKEASFQLGYRSYVQLGIRSGQYKLMNSVEVYDGEIKSTNRITGEVIVNEGFIPTSESKIVGYMAYFRLLSGFEKYLYMTYDEVFQHAKRWSKGYNKEKKILTGIWADDFDAMARKTVLKKLLNGYGVLSTEMQTAIVSDQAVIRVNADGEIVTDYVDNPAENLLHQAKQELPAPIELEIESANIVTDKIFVKVPFEGEKEGDMITLETIVTTKDSTHAVVDDEVTSEPVVNTPEKAPEEPVAQQNPIEATLGGVSVVETLLQGAREKKDLKELNGYKKKIKAPFNLLSAQEQEEFIKGWTEIEKNLTK